MHLFGLSRKSAVLLTLSGWSEVKRSVESVGWGLILVSISVGLAQQTLP
jgi:hypothetical protein